MKPDRRFILTSLGALPLAAGEAARTTFPTRFIHASSSSVIGGYMTIGG